MYVLSVFALLGQKGGDLAWQLVLEIETLHILRPISRAMELRPCDNHTRCGQEYFQLFSAKVLSRRENE